MDRPYAIYLCKRIFHFDCGSDDVTVWRQFWPSWRIYKSLLFFFCDNSKTYQNIIRFSVHVCRVYATKPVNIGVNVVNNDVIRFEDYFEFWITVISFLFGLECRSKGQTIGSAVSYLDDILKCECRFMQKRSPRHQHFVKFTKFEISNGDSIPELADWAPPCWIAK